MKLSIVIICWNDLKVLPACLKSIYEQTRSTEFEVLISDNGSTDGSLDYVRQNYPQARILENRANLGYARGNNAGIRATGDAEYVLILNPDTIIHEGALDKWVAWADQNPSAGAFGCNVRNPDGSYQHPARPFPTVWRYWVSALFLRPLGRFSNLFLSDTYSGWNGTTQRPIDWQSGCCVMFRGKLLKELGGFDERFFYHFEEVDLCYRVWQSGHPIMYNPDVVITHLGGQSVGRFPIRFELEKYRNRYRYFHKHYGLRGAQKCQTVSIAYLRIRQLGWGLVGWFKKSEAIKNRMAMFKVVIDWNRRIDVQQFIHSGQEPNVGYEPLTPAPPMAA
jgi:GT2 family glycosyltransferase